MGSTEHNCTEILYHFLGAVTAVLFKICTVFLYHITFFCSLHGTLIGAFLAI